MKSLPWFRLYADVYRNPKVARLTDKQFRFWVGCLCLASENAGFLPSDQDISFQLRMSEHAAASRKAELLAAGLLDDTPDGFKPHNWADRQFQSDSSHERVVRYRERMRQSGNNTTSYLKHKPYVFERDESQCVYCGSIENLCLDHSIPIIQGGDDDPANLVCSCKSCNSKKRGRTPPQAEMPFVTVEAQSRFEDNIDRLQGKARARDASSDSNALSPLQSLPKNRYITDTDTEQIQTQNAPAGAGVTEISSKPKTKGKKRDPPEWLRHWFEGRFWPSRWRNEGKAYALLCLAQKVDTEEQAEAELLSMLAQREQYLRRPTDKRPHMSTWINQDRAKDEPELFDRGMDPGTKQEQANAVFEALMEDRLRGQQQIYTRRLE